MEKALSGLIGTKTDGLRAGTRVGDNIDHSRSSGMDRRPVKTFKSEDILPKVTLRND